MHFTAIDIAKLERFYRANLLNSATGYKPANLIGTISETGCHNLAIFSSVVHLGSDPGLIGFIQRPITAQSHSYKNIIQTGYYTINHVHHQNITQAHWTSASFEAQVSEFEACGFSPEFVDGFRAPYVRESLVRIGLEFVDQMPIKLNNTILMIGKIVQLHVIDCALMPNGNIDLEVAQSVCISGLESYYSASKLVSFPYAKLDNIPNFELDGRL